MRKLGRASVISAMMDVSRVPVRVLCFCGTEDWGELKKMTDSVVRTLEHGRMPGSIRTKVEVCPVKSSEIRPSRPSNQHPWCWLRPLASTVILNNSESGGRVITNFSQTQTPFPQPIPSKKF